MNWMAWIANKHTLLVHLPMAAVLMIPVPILAAQRGGRGIRPWWVTCRYLGWAGVLGSVAAILSGFFLGRAHGYALLGAFWEPTAQAGNNLLRFHAASGAASLLLGVACLRSLYRTRQEHQGIGLLPLLLGLLWGAGVLATSTTAGLLAGHGPALSPLPAAPSPSPSPAPSLRVPVRPAQAEQGSGTLPPSRILDYASLRPMHLEPVKSMAHGNRWIRVWVTPAAAQAYQAGLPLPQGALAVLSTVEDRWGRPGYEVGPVYALEMSGEGKPSFSFYWAQVPELHRGENNGAERVYWRNDDPGLKACVVCHEHGIAPLKDRSRFGIPRKPKAEAATSPLQ